MCACVYVYTHGRTFPQTVQYTRACVYIMPRRRSTQQSIRNERMRALTHAPRNRVVAVHGSVCECVLFTSHWVSADERARTGVQRVCAMFTAHHTHTRALGKRCREQHRIPNTYVMCRFTLTHTLAAACCLHICLYAASLQHPSSPARSQIAIPGEIELLSLWDAFFFCHARGGGGVFARTLC